MDIDKLILRGSTLYVDAGFSSLMDIDKLILETEAAGTEVGL